MSARIDKKEDEGSFICLAGQEASRIPFVAPQRRLFLQQTAWLAIISTVGAFESSRRAAGLTALGSATGLTLLLEVRRRKRVASKPDRELPDEHVVEGSIRSAMRMLASLSAPALGVVVGDSSPIIGGLASGIALGFLVVAAIDIPALFRIEMRERWRAFATVPQRWGIFGVGSADPYYYVDVPSG